MITKYKRKEYFYTTLALFVVSFLIYGCLSIFLEATLFYNVWTRFLFFGCVAGYGFSSLLSGIILFSRYIALKSLTFKTICCCFFPITAAIIVYTGVFSFIPYEIYNVCMLIKERHAKKKKRNI